MLKIVTLLLVITNVLAASIPEGLLPQLDGRIVGGKETDIIAHPYQVSLQRWGSHSCGGSVLRSRYILTAAHCVISAAISSLKVRAGSTCWNSGGVLVDVDSVQRHQGYNSRTMVNDIAVIKLTSSLIFSSTIKPIALATNSPSSGTSAVVSGWGVTGSPSYDIPNVLRSVDLKIVSLETCKSPTYGYGAVLKPSMMCATAEGADSCQGDSGGPLVSDGVQAGVVSWGYGCAQPKFPGVYADVPYLKSWVEEAITSM